METSDFASETAQIVAKAKRILIYDSWPNVVKFMKLHLERCDYQVDPAESAEDVLARIELHRPDLLITNAETPKLEGLELVKSVRADAGLIDLPILLTWSKAADRDGPDIEYLLGCGASRTLTKPFNPAELTAIVREMLYSRNLSEDKNV